MSDVKVNENNLIASQLAKHSYDIIKIIGDNDGAGAAKETANVLVQILLTNILSDVLCQYKDLNISAKDKYEFTNQSYKDYKHALEKHISFAFEDAFKFLTNQDHMFNCDVYVVPEPENDMEN